MTPKQPLRRQSWSLALPQAATRGRSQLEGPGEATSTHGLAPYPACTSTQLNLAAFVQPPWPLLAHLPFVLCSPVVEGCLPGVSGVPQCRGAQPSPVVRSPKGLPSCLAWPSGGSRSTAPLSIGWAGGGGGPWL